MIYADRMDDCNPRVMFIPRVGVGMEMNDMQ